MQDGEVVQRQLPPTAAGLHAAQSVLLLVCVRLSQFGDSGCMVVISVYCCFLFWLAFRAHGCQLLNKHSLLPLVAGVGHG
jgi:hypothetical protein